MNQQTALLTQDFAQAICEIFREETNHAVIMVNKEGMIFAATDRRRIGSWHPVAKQVVEGTIHEGVVTLEEQERNPSVRAGINIPIIYKGERLAAMGIAGDPQAVRPLVGLAARTIQLWLVNREQLQFLTQTIQGINHQLHDMYTIIEEMNASAQQISAASEETHLLATGSGEKVQKIEEVFRLVKTIATRSNLIGLNAAIEAARVGEHGRGFMVVAGEVRKLAATSQESVENVQSVLQEIARLFATISDKVRENNETNQMQSRKIETLVERVSHIENTMNEFLNTLTQNRD